MNIYQIITDRIIKQLEQGIIPWNKPWISVRDYAYSRSTGKPYSLLNQLLLEKPGEYLTFKQCTEAGGHVRKGEKSSIVVFWRIYDKKTTAEDGTVKTEHIPILKYINVFHIDQCEGINPKYKQPVLNDFDPITEAESIALQYSERTGVTITNCCQNRAFYRPAEDAIYLPMKEQFHSPAHYYATLFHEMGHSTGHESRLNRIAKGAAFGSEEYSKEELVAEMTSAVIMNRLNMETEGTMDNTAAYIKSWLDVLKKDNRLIVSAASKAEKAVSLILNEQQTTDESTEQEAA